MSELRWIDQINMKYRNPMISAVSHQRAPFSEMVYLKADFSTLSSVIHVRFELRHEAPGIEYNGSIVDYDGHEWSCPSLTDQKDPAVMVSNAVMLEVWNEEWEEHKSRAYVEANPFWKNFVTEVEKTWSVISILEQ